MKKLINFATIAVAFAPLFVSAQNIPSVKPISGNTDIPGLIGTIAGYATGLLIALATLFVIYAAFVYLTAAGDPKAVETAKNVIIYAVVAVAVALLSQVAAQIVKAIIGTG